jgi:glyoxylase-like metal-dependent hydrolase (beta-lactamase superfamily II)
MRVGALEITPVIDGWARMPATDLLRFTGGRDDPWLPHQEFLNGDGTIELSLGGFLVRTGDRVVLIDAGAGRIDNEIFHGGQMLESLAALGLSTDDVTDVIFTHLHFDHVGWATQKGVVVFPRATFRCHAHDWDHFVAGPNPEAGSVRKLSPLSDRLEPFEEDTTVAPGVTVRHAPGHTPGSAVIVVADGTERALLLGDALPDVAVGDHSAPLDGLVAVLGVGETKGLEFDGVIVVEPARIAAQSARGMSDLYVALTRATRRLGVVHSEPLPKEMERLRPPSGERPVAATGP